MPEKIILLDEYVFWGWSFSQPQTTLKVLRNSLLQVFFLAFWYIDIKTMTATKSTTNTTLETCDVWGTDYNSDIWEPEFLTIFVTWQLRAPLDSIRIFLRFFEVEVSYNCNHSTLFGTSFNIHFLIHIWVVFFIKYNKALQ